MTDTDRDRLRALQDRWLGLSYVVLHVMTPVRPDGMRCACNHPNKADPLLPVLRDRKLVWMCPCGNSVSAEVVSASAARYKIFADDDQLESVSDSRIAAIDHAKRLRSKGGIATRVFDKQTQTDVLGYNDA